MATFRVGVGSFNIQDGAVGFGTDTDGLGNLKVKGVTKTTGSIVSGASTLTRYSGFAADNINQLENITLTSEVGTIGDIVVGVGTSVIISSGSTVTVGTVESVSIGTHFSPPVGGIEDRGEDFVEGMMRFNTDLNTMEFYNGNVWRQFTYIADIQNSPSNRGRMITMGGRTPSSPYSISDMQSIQINTRGISKYFGVLTQSRSHNTALANEIRGMCVGGFAPETDIIDYVTMASEGDAIDFGNLTSSKYGGGGAASSTRGLFCGGYDSPGNTNDIDFFEIMTLGNALDFGDLTRARRYGTSVASPTRVVTTGGTGDSYTTTQAGARMTDIFTISSKGNAVDFAPLSADAQQMSGFANSTRGIFLMQASADRNKIDHLNLVSGGEGIQHGELTHLTSAQQAGGCNHVRGLFAGGFNTPGTSSTNHIDMVEIQTSGSAQDFGDLAVKISCSHGCSDSHGGLGGY